MIDVRKSAERGHADHGWLDTYHTFSFASYFDAEHMKFRALRVINEDRVAGGKGFDTHPHENMEIVTYIIDGELEHRDSMGNGSIIRPGELQRMTAGSGVTHSEFNPSEQTTHLLQIWIYPESLNLTPGYEQKAFPRLNDDNALVLLASRDGHDDSLTIHQDVEIFGGRLQTGKELEYGTGGDRYVWIQMIKGHLELDGTSLQAGDGAAVYDESILTLRAQSDSEFLLFNLG